MDIPKNTEDKELGQSIAELIMSSASTAKCVVCMPKWDNLQQRTTSKVDIAELKKSNDDNNIVTEME